MGGYVAIWDGAGCFGMTTDDVTDSTGNIIESTDDIIESTGDVTEIATLRQQSPRRLTLKTLL